MADAQVQAVQRWLNNTYGSKTGWVPLVEDGLTGWNTIYGLRRGLQAELNISPLAQGFGPATRAAFVSQIGQIGSASILSRNIWKILSGSFWCKGYTGIYGVYVLEPNGPDPDALSDYYDNENAWFGLLAPSLTSMRGDLGLSTVNPYVDVKLMASLLAMDAFQKIHRGTNEVREVQQWLNGTYLHRADSSIVPCDGVYSRQIQSALIYAIQYEVGIPDGTANGAFGNLAKQRLLAQGQIGVGNVDGAKRFVRLFQAAMRFNSLDAPFDGAFSTGMESTISDYQAFMEIPESGNGDYPTWCNLLVSCGDTAQPTTGFDTSTRLLGGLAAGAVARGYTHVGRYTMSAASTSTKWITAPELDALRDAGLRLFPIQQFSNDSAEAISGTDGQQGQTKGFSQGVMTLERCRMLGFPDDAIVYFAIDFDPQGPVIDGPVVDFFTGIHRALNSIPDGLRPGVYGTRNVCTRVIEEGKAVVVFVSGMSSGFSGNMGFPMPQEWYYNQIIEVDDEPLGGVPTGVDHVKVSRRAESINLAHVVSPPLEVDGSQTSTGFDAVFEWVVRGEIACEQALFGASTPLNPAVFDFVPYYVLHHLRKPEYWDGGNGLMWKAYTPMDMHSQGDVLTQQALNGLDPTKPTSNRDFAHWAATTLGYLTWGMPTDFDAYGFGDFGGWALDLLQAWGARIKTAPSSDLETWMRANLGVTTAGRFGPKDLVADADGWLIAQGLSILPSRRLSSALRTSLKSTAAERISSFYAGRFDSSADNVSTQFQSLVDGVDLGTIPNLPFTTSALRVAAGMEGSDPLPTAAQADICARALAERLANPL